MVVNVSAALDVLQWSYVLSVRCDVRYCPWQYRSALMTPTQHRSGLTRAIIHRTSQHFHLFELK